MVKIWAKTIYDEKITRSIIYERADNFNSDIFSEYVIELCYILDIPTPIIIEISILNFIKFNISRFKRTDFMDVVDFDMLVLENASE